MSGLLCGGGRVVSLERGEGLAPHSLALVWMLPVGKVLPHVPVAVKRRLELAN